MLEIHAPQFLQVMRSLSLIESLFRQHAAEAEAAVHLDEHEKRILESNLHNIKVHTEPLGLKVPSIWVRDFLRRLDRPDWQKVDYSECQQRLEKIRSAIDAELEGTLFLFLSTNELNQYRKDVPYGKAVYTRFKRAAEDVEEAGKCLALGRSTACVLHLMRVMEIGVRRLAKKLSITPGPKDTWGMIVGSVKTAIAKMPNNTQQEVDQKVAFNEAAMHLGHVCVGIRNPTMHPKRTYTPEQAEGLFKNVGEFMQVLSRVLQM